MLSLYSSIILSLSATLVIFPCIGLSLSSTSQVSDLINELINSYNCCTLVNFSLSPCFTKFLCFCSCTQSMINSSYLAINTCLSLYIVGTVPQRRLIHLSKGSASRDVCLHSFVPYRIVPSTSPAIMTNKLLFISRISLFGTSRDRVRYIYTVYCIYERVRGVLKQ
jgi:hypothetical protein